MRNRTTPFLALTLVLAVACGVAEEDAVESTSSAPPLPEHFHLAAEPDGAVDVGGARADAADGDAVVVRGVVGGSVRPFVDGLAAFTIVDPSITSCADMGEDHCPKPWDYCCEDPTSLTANSATVEMRDGDAPMAADPRGFHGLAELSTVVVEGTAHRDAGGNLIVAATGVWVAP